MKLFIFIFFNTLIYATQHYNKNTPQITAERPLQLSLRACTSQLAPFQLDTMLFFPNDLQICGSVESNKGMNSMARDRGRTTHLRSLVFLSLSPVGSYLHCHMTFSGYLGEYRFAPDFGYYQPCQRFIAQHLNHIIELEKDVNIYSKNRSIPTLNLTSINCPILSLPDSIKELDACKLKEGQWYELSFRSAIQFEMLLSERNLYQQTWVNHSTTFVFKPDREVWRSGNELYWLQRLLQLRVKMKNCEAVRYLLKLDESWSSSLPVTVFIDYQVRENAYVKHSKHLGNGTLMDGWFTGTFPIWRTSELRTHELCVQFAWQLSINQYRLCRSFLRGRSTLDCDPVLRYTQYSIASKTKSKNKLTEFVIYTILIIFLSMCLNFF